MEMQEKDVGPHKLMKYLSLLRKEIFFYINQ